MIGYINDKNATSATIDEEGWLHTGKIIYCKLHGNLKQYFTR